MATASHIELTPSTAGVYHAPDITTQSSKIGSDLLQENHDRNHIFFNKSGFHNHIAHHLLTIFSLGATPAELQSAFDTNKGYQRSQFPVKERNVQAMSDRAQFASFLGQEQFFSDYEAFFRAEIDAKGWETVLQEQLFARDEHAERLLPRMFGGFFHPIIHLGLGVEFTQPAIIVEALAQAAIHDGWVAEFLFATEKAAASSASESNSNSKSKSLTDLLHETQQSPTLRSSPHWDDGNKVRDGVLVRARDDMLAIASQWTVKPEELERKTAEMINCAIYFTGAAQRPNKAVKFDFYYMHCANSSLFFSVFLTQEWLSVEDKCRLLEWKGRMDLALYVSRACPELRVEEISRYQPKNAEDGWDEIRKRAAKFGDDGHAAKLVRAVAHGEKVCRPFEEGGREGVGPIKGEMWLKLGHMAIDSVEAGDPHWVRSAGFDEAWTGVPDRARL